MCWKTGQNSKGRAHTRKKPLKVEQNRPHKVLGRSDHRKGLGVAGLKCWKPLPEVASTPRKQPGFALSVGCAEWFALVFEARPPWSLVIPPRSTSGSARLDRRLYVVGR